MQDFVIVLVQSLNTHWKISRGFRTLRFVFSLCLSYRWTSVVLSHFSLLLPALPTVILNLGPGSLPIFRATVWVLYFVIVMRLDTLCLSCRIRMPGTRSCLLFTSTTNIYRVFITMDCINY